MKTVRRIVQSPDCLIAYILPLAGLSLLLGLLTGLLRLGWSIPMTASVGQHGALMIGSFMGTLILLERAVVFSSRWALLVPLLNGLSLPAFFLGWPTIAQALLLIGSLGMVGMTYLFLLRYRHSYYYLLVGGSMCLAIGDVLLLKTGFYPLTISWWIAFLLLTIVAERLELSRFLPVSPVHRSLLWIAIGIFLVGVAQPFHGIGQPLMGIGMVMLAIWLCRFDMAIKSIRKLGQARYSGSLLLIGFGWLLASGLLFLWPIRNGLWYDAALHSFFLGFVFSMIFAHAPIMLPGILRQTGVFFHPILYGWAFLNSLALAVRLWADYEQTTNWRMGSGVVQGIALVGFLGVIAVMALSRRITVRRGFRAFPAE